MLTCLYRAACSPRESKRLVGREAALVTGVGDSYGNGRSGLLFLALLWSLVLQISVKAFGNEEQGLSLRVCAAHSVVAQPERPWHGKKC